MQIQSMNSETEPFARRLDSAGWALFIIWIGVALLGNVGWGWGLIGVSAIILGEALVRWLKHVPIHGFSIAMGLLFLLGGLWEVLPVSWPLMPVLMIGFGLALLFKAFRGRHVP